MPLITVDLDEKWPIYELIEHAEDGAPECAVLVTETSLAEIKRITKEFAAVQAYLKDAHEIQRLKWEFNNGTAHREDQEGEAVCPGCMRGDCSDCDIDERGFGPGDQLP